MQKRTYFRDIDMIPSNLEFAVFTGDQIKKISVVKIITGLTYDSLGHPFPGGLYDNAMGTHGKTIEICSTCQSYANCPGHMGHIELNALVFNPIFLKLAYDILRICCLKCMSVQMESKQLEIVMLQLQLVDAGYVIEAQEIEIYKSEFVWQNTEEFVKSENGERTHPRVAQMRELLAKGEKNTCNNTKTTCGIRTALVHNALQCGAAKKCMHCHSPLKKVRFVSGKLNVHVKNEELEERSQGDQMIKRTTTKPLLADECRHYLRDIYKQYSTLLKLIFPVLQSASDWEYPVDLIFMNIIPVTPPKSRPSNVVNNHVVEHSRTSVYKTIVERNSVLRAIMIKIKNEGEVLENIMGIYESAKGTSPFEKMYFAWLALQAAVDLLLDSTLNKNTDDSEGLKQILEKKEGLIRKHMMGKRVNYAARTVITPDPNINVEELGIPDIFARKLSFPVPVTPWNVAELRKLVMNGPNEYPGANYIQDETGATILIPHKNPAKRESMAKLLLSGSKNSAKVVHRHILNGDVLLLNRQPTLHKSSIMAHKARVLRGEKTFRLHYSNCKSYNADFDGDEMNAHLPQNHVARAEAYHLANVSSNYLVPKDGSPLGGLIQDHVISGVKLSIRGRFFNKEDYQQLVFQGLSHLQGNIKLLPPTILKPMVLWSGKQVLSTILINIIPKGYDAINLTSFAKIDIKCWKLAETRKFNSGGTPLTNADMTESQVIIRHGELLAGVLDKKHYGAMRYSLVHNMYELYGGEVSTRLLTSFTKIFTTFLQREGFTLGVQDILVTSNADAQRRKIIKDCRKIGNNAVAAALDLESDTPHDVLASKMEEAYIENTKFRVILDRKYKSMLDEYTNQINKVCLPDGLISQFPENNLQLMVLSGAKGSTVNTMQISCLLGQIELEGKRPPLMISGKSLPSFTSYETSPKSGGFIDGRFMTGIQPQDFFFHCMAGREGLIDTAVKTSRSGYLQRCLIKHLEGLNVHYDLTVRDSDNSVIQFLYGEDGMDILKAGFFSKKCIKLLDMNSSVILRSSELESIKDDVALIPVENYAKKLRTWKNKNRFPYSKRFLSSFTHFSKELRNEVEIDNPNERNERTGRLKIDEALITLWTKADTEAREKYKKKYGRRPDPIISKYKPDNFYGSISENVEDIIEYAARFCFERKDIMTDIMYIKSMKALAAPGEPVGLLAAQSIGEPSTQMTLNTFHFAGRGEMNVTLGIPRLREILMLASQNIKTPSMDIPVLKDQKKAADKLRIKLNRVTLADVLESVNVKISLVLKPVRANQYTISFKFLPREAYQDDFIVKPKKILQHMTDLFFKQFFRSIMKSSKDKNTVIDICDDKPKKGSKSDKFAEKYDEDDDEADDKGTKKSKNDKVTIVDEDSDDDAANADDDDATGIKLKNRKHDETEYDDPEGVEEIEDANEEEMIPDEQDEELTHEEQNEDDEIAKVLSNEMVNGYVYDTKNHLWCKLTFDLPVRYRKPNISTIIRELAAKSVVHQVPKINRAILYKSNEDLLLKTDGINFFEMFKHDKILNINRMFSNDVHAVANIYGIEAAAKVIVKEVQNVFKVYGITVDPRHLLLIADYMTFDGTYKPLSRRGMENSSSPLLQMSFESCLQFLKAATIAGRSDELNSPSSRIMVGLPVLNGTGCFDLRCKLNK